MKIPIFIGGLYWDRWALDLVPATIKLNRRYSWHVQFGSRSAIIDDTPHKSKHVGCGRWKTIQRARHVVMVEAWAQIRDAGRTVIIKAGNLHRRLESGPDHYWQHDELGLALVRISDQQDYHPSAQVLLSPDLDGHYNAAATVDSIKRSIEWAAIRREQINRNSKLEEADIKEAWVSLRDSLSSGNCLDGSLQWAVQKRINIYRHHPAARLMELDGDNPRVLAAVKAAVARHKREMAEGFCELKDHVA